MKLRRVDSNHCYIDSKSIALPTWLHLINIGESRLYLNSEDLSRLTTYRFYILELLVVARFKDGVRFELTGDLTTTSDFQDRCNKPLYHPPKRRASRWQKMGRRCQKPDTSSRNRFAKKGKIEST